MFLTICVFPGQYLGNCTSEIVDAIIDGILEQRKAYAYLQHGNYDDATIDVHAVAATHASSKVLFEKESDKKPPKEWKYVLLEVLTWIFVFNSDIWVTPLVRFNSDTAV